MAVAAVCLVLTGDRLGARECARPLPVCEAATRADLVFSGEVLEEITYAEQTPRGPKPQGIQAVRFKVNRAFKGVHVGESWGLYYFGVEARPFKQGNRYLVFAHRRVTGAFVTGCTLTREIGESAEDAWSETEAAELGNCFKTRR